MTKPCETPGIEQPAELAEVSDPRFVVSLRPAPRSIRHTIGRSQAKSDAAILLHASAWRDFVDHRETHKGDIVGLVHHLRLHPRCFTEVLK